MNKNANKLVAALAALVVAAGCSVPSSGSPVAATEAQAAASEHQAAQNNASSSASLDEPKRMQQASKRLTSASGELELTVPDNWSNDPVLERTAMLNASHRGEEQYVVVNRYPKSDFSDGTSLEAYKQTFLAATSASIEAFEEEGTERLDINGRSGILVTFSGTSDNVNVRYIAGLAETEHAFYQVVAWSTASKFSEHEAQFKAVIGSLKVQRETLTQHSGEAKRPHKQDETEPGVVMRSADGTLELTLPGSWEEMPLNDEADLQGGVLATEDYFIAMHEPKAMFADDMNLAQYTSLVLENMATALENGAVGEPAAVEVNGMPALQTELSGEVESVKIRYLVTTVEAEQSYVQVLFWTQHHLMADKLGDYRAAVETLNVNESQWPEGAR
ncbi:hypothetical protein IDH44_22220 [Paenibacillus sp. IB182496]|uniref:DUF1795 domain-containing protein n=1 Tax=Paenibacillus sabuli TaxID=2772509 RepID=A0A927GU92_9BACL|nr:hypothetical protein [Paenibacillus sabuli]MBD2847920.1 hypothetical protein [Paenibacillus sabuli]